MHTSKKGKTKRGEEQKLCLFQRQQTEGKRIWNFNKLKKKKFAG